MGKIFNKNAKAPEIPQAVNRSRRIRTRLKQRIFGILRFESARKATAPLSVFALQPAQKSTRLRSKNLF